ncbi:hypothetical protein M5D96_004305, partial [Drosophila gunungcola]
MGRVGQHNFGQLIDTLRPSRFHSRESARIPDGISQAKTKFGGILWLTLSHTKFTNGSTPLTMSDILQ